MRAAPAAAGALSLLLLLACGSSTPAPSPSPRAVLTPTPSPTASATPSPTPVPPPKVMVVVLENNAYENVIGNSSAPAINRLARRYGLATHYYARRHPSLPNYIDMVSGRTFDITSDCTQCSVHGTSIADQLEGAGQDWRAYMESMPAPCFQGDSYAGLYAKKHDPFMYFDDIRTNPVRCAKVRPFTGFYADLDGDRLPAYTFVTPNMCHDGHDCPLRTSDTWVDGFTQRVLASPWFAGGGVLFLTYDEGTTDAGCCQVATGGHIVTLVVARSITAGRHLDTPVDHAGLLRTIEALYGQPHLGEADCPCSGDLLTLVRASG